MPVRLEGRARLVGEDVNTDYIISSSRKRETLDPAVLKRHLFETVDPGFAASIRPGDLLVAGKNFGCGSAMEVAATAVLGAGIRAVLARSFARTYFRNAVNNGLVPVECDTRGIVEGDALTVELGDRPEVHVARSGQTVMASPLPAIMRDILAAGGLIDYIRRHGNFVVGPTRNG